MRKILLVGASITALLLSSTAAALAQDDAPPAPSCGDALVALAEAQRVVGALPETVPNPAAPGLAGAVAAAEATLAAAVVLVVEYGPDVYPGGVVPAVGDVDPELLAAMLADPDLGGGARAEVEAAVTAFANLDAARAVLAAAPATVPNPALTDGPEFDALAAARSDTDKACTGTAGSDGSDGTDGTDGTDDRDAPQIAVVPSYAPDTGGGPA